MKHPIYKLLLIITLLVIVVGIAIQQPVGKVIYLRLFLLIFILIESVVLFKTQVVDRKINNLLSNIGSLLVSFFVIFLVLEMIFMFVPKSHGAGNALSARIWLNKYQKPINSYGFRDKEPKKNSPAILFVGDSFTEGQGLTDTDERFSNIVGAEFPKLATINIGKRGLETAKEFKVMTNFIEKTNIQPEVIVLQYFGNDIDETAFSNGLSFGAKPAYFNVPSIFKPLIKGSYFLNFIYWMLPQGDATAYKEFLQRAYQSDEIFSKHKQDLQLFVDYANQHSIKLVVIVFPFLWNTEESDELYVNSIIHFFEENNATAISVSPLVQDIPVEKRIINVNDSHASKEVNARVAQAILERLK